VGDVTVHPNTAAAACSLEPDHDEQMRLVEPSGGLRFESNIVKRFVELAKHLIESPWTIERPDRTEHFCCLDESEVIDEIAVRHAEPAIEVSVPAQENQRPYPADHRLGHDRLKDSA
jgi:hypothetical protein